jgi:hypothetical protein
VIPFHFHSQAILTAQVSFLDYLIKHEKTLINRYWVGVFALVWCYSLVLSLVPLLPTPWPAADQVVRRGRLYYCSFGFGFGFEFGFGFGFGFVSGLAFAFGFGFICFFRSGFGISFGLSFGFGIVFRIGFAKFGNGIGFFFGFGFAFALSIPPVRVLLFFCVCFFAPLLTQPAPRPLRPLRAPPVRHPGARGIHRTLLWPRHLRRASVLALLQFGHREISLLD